MTSLEALPAEDQVRLREAACWSATFQREPQAELTPEFQQWVCDPENVRALQAVEKTMAALEEHGAAPSIVKMRQSSLHSLRTAGTKRWFAQASRYAAAAAILLAVGGTASYYLAHRPTKYQTDVGGRQVVALPDGSRISLDSDSLVKVHFEKSARQVTLVKGRARFDVAHDVSRPFTVTAGDQTVVAVGTSFDLEKRGDNVLVTLIQGRVLVKKADAILAGAAPSVPAISMTAGQELTAVPDHQPTVQVADLEVTQAWELGHLVFRGEPLSDAVTEINRYTEHPITVDPSAATIRISGVFNTGDIGSFVSAITGYFPVQATTDSNGAITLQKRS